MASYSAWPPANAHQKTLYFRSGGMLSFDPPSDGASTAEGSKFDEYVSDPAKPVPYVNYPAQDVPQEYMVSDQRFAEAGRMFWFTKRLCFRKT